MKIYCTLISTLIAIAVMGQSVEVKDAHKKIAQTFSPLKILPDWAVEWHYALSAPRLTEEKDNKYIGGYDPKRGEVFFISGAEIVFNPHQVNIQSDNGMNIKSLNNGSYEIRIKWDNDMITGAYTEGEIFLYHNNVELQHGPVTIIEW